MIDFFIDCFEVAVKLEALTEACFLIEEGDVSFVFGYCQVLSSFLCHLDFMKLVGHAELQRLHPVSVPEPVLELFFRTVGQVRSTE